jgi:prepilin-type N-terminal cleavage/methylation domain-containing protein
MQQARTKGMTLVELLVAVALITLLFGGVLSSFQIVMTLIGSSKAHSGALALANDRIEYIRSLQYDNVGTIGGIPNGPVPQIASTTQNGVEYSERVLIGYIDDPKDGLGGSDTNGILADYKQVKVEYSWIEKGEVQSISLISNIVPPGIETTAGGGTLTVNVFDAEVLPVAGAAVRVYNNSGTTTIDTIRYTNAQGIAMFSGAPARANYQITVTDVGYSTDQTYSASTSNPNPLTPHVAVLESEVSTMNFQIDELSNVTVETVGLPTTGQFVDLFDDSTKIASTNNVSVIAGKVALEETAGVLTTSGTLFSTPITPGTLDSWDTFSVQTNTPLNTSVVTRVYDTTGTTTPTLIPDTDLPGNSAGFAPGSVNLSSLDTSTYQSITLGSTLNTSDTSTSSEIYHWSIAYTETQSPISGVPFTFTSTKTIGTTALPSPVYKYQQSFTTNGSGQVSISNLEWDVYNISINNASYDVAEACSNIPYSLEPGVSETLRITLAPATTYSLRARVVDIDGNSIPNAEVELSRGGFAETLTTSVCGQAFFNTGLSNATDYELNVNAFGYVPQEIIEITVNDDELITVTLNSL